VSELLRVSILSDPWTISYVGYTHKLISTCKICSQSQQSTLWWANKLNTHMVVSRCLVPPLVQHSPLGLVLALLPYLHLKFMYFQKERFFFFGFFTYLKLKLYILYNYINLLYLYRNRKLQNSGQNKFSDGMFAKWKPG
jgi:hypothetical protein